MSVRARISQGGRVVIPAAYRRALGLEPGDEVVLSLEDGKVRITTTEQLIQNAQALIQQYIPAGRSLVDELMAERRAEAAGE